MRATAAIAGLTVCLFLLAAGCTAPLPPTPGLVRVLPPTATPLPPPLGAADEAWAVVAAEAEAVRQQDIDALAQLWLPDGQVVDVAHTPDTDTDDRRWQGWPAIRERYTHEVFSYPAEADLGPRPRSPRPTITVQDGRAEVMVPGPDGRTPRDRWQLQLVDSSWRIARLEYNLDPQSSFISPE
ncbi:MAG: hypothetical protein HPY83_01155 [Anaerolineae bacterium]|nr:hypothetical protein [Anaerolineae bacterium]